MARDSFSNSQQSIGHSRGFLNHFGVIASEKSEAGASRRGYILGFRAVGEEAVKEVSKQQSVILRKITEMLDLTKTFGQAAFSDA